MDHNFKIIEHCSQYVEKVLINSEGCTDNYKVREAVFSTFNHLSVYFPEAYEDMIKVWGVSDV